MSLFVNFQYPFVSEEKGGLHDDSPVGNLDCLLLLVDFIEGKTFFDDVFEHLSVGWLFCFTAYQNFSGHLTQN